MCCNINSQTLDNLDSNSATRSGVNPNFTKRDRSDSRSIVVVVQDDATTTAGFDRRNYMSQSYVSTAVGDPMLPLGGGDVIDGWWGWEEEQWNLRLLGKVMWTH